MSENKKSFWKRFRNIFGFSHVAQNADWLGGVVSGLVVKATGVTLSSVVPPIVVGLAVVLVVTVILHAVS